MNDAIQQLVGFLQNASPVVWQAVYRQVYIEGVESVLAMFAFLFATGFAWRWLRKNWENADEMVCALMVLLIIVGFFVSGVFLYSAVDDFANPTFQAIQQLAGLVVKK